MKTLLRISLLGLGLVFRTYGQGYIAFNNYAPGPSPVTINTTPGAFNPVNGPAGAFIGSNYTASLLLVEGTVSDQAVFDSLNPIWLADTLFFGTTGTGPGHGLSGDGSGFFDGGDLRLMGLSTLFVTLQVRAWYNGGGAYTSYASARAAGQNAGKSNLLPLEVILPPGPVNNLRGLQPFTVGIPEPSTFVLAAFGGAAVLLFRVRR